jgi:hypothetical protein
MEGTWSTVDEVLSPAIGDAGRSATASVRGYASALVHGIQVVQIEGLAALTPNFLCTLHEKVMQKDPGSGYSWSTPQAGSSRRRGANRQFRS